MDPLLQRLKERKLVQWGLAYLAGAWVLLQLLDLLSDTYAWPPAIMRAVPVLLGVGLLAALVLAWYHGEQGRQRASGPELLMLAGILVIAGGVVWAMGRSAVAGSVPAGKSAVAPAALAARSIAVLPFANMSSDPENEYFSDGITEDILTRLSKVPGMRVISRTSVVGYKRTTKKIGQIGDELGVAHVLEGSVRRSGDRVRITAQLINADTDEHLWAETYDRQLTDIFAIQGEIAQQISEALQLRLSAGERNRIARSGTGSIVAYDLYLKGREYLRQAPSGPQELRDNVISAIALFRQALREDSTYALAYAGLAEAYRSHPDHPTKLKYDSVVAFAQRAIKLDPELPEGYLALSHAYALTAEWNRVDQEARRALRLNPNHVDAISAVANVALGKGEFANAVRGFKRAAALEPTVASHFFQVSNVYLIIGDFRRAEPWEMKAIQLPPNPLGAHCKAAEYALRRGEIARADREIRAMLAMDPDHPWAAYCAGWHELQRGNYAAARSHLERYAAGENVERQPFEELAYVYGKLGDSARAAEILRKAEARARRRWHETEGRNWNYALAKVLAMQGNKEEALRYLKRTVDDGWIEYYNEYPLPFLENLRGDPRYEQMMAGVKARLDRERLKAEREAI